MIEYAIERQKCISLPTISKRYKEILASNRSAPFYLYCLKKEHKFSFTKPTCDPRPPLLIDSIVKETDIVNLIKMLQFDNENQFLGDYLWKKGILNNQHKTEKLFLTSLIIESIDYAAQKEFTAIQLASLLNIYISTHNYMKSSNWRQPIEIWNYFKEFLICLTIEDSPDGQEMFSPEESYDILTHFHTIYMKNVPLVHILVFGEQRMRFFWSFN